MKNISVGCILPTASFSFCDCFTFQKHYVRERSRSVAKRDARKRKRDESVAARSESRARSASRVTPRDKSGIRDEKVRDLTESISSPRVFGRGDDSVLQCDWGCFDNIAYCFCAVSFTSSYQRYIVTVTAERPARNVVQNRCVCMC